MLQIQNAPPSVTSSRMSNIASEDGDGDAGDASGDPRMLPIQTTPTSPLRASAQERNLATSRPSSSATGTTIPRGTPSQRPPSRRGHLNVGNPAGFRTSTPVSALPAGAAVGRSASAASRPQSAATRSHVPSLTSHAFFRPMSSQRLQAQRAIRQSRTGRAGSSDGSYSEGGSNTHRHSYSSNPAALQRSSLASQDLDNLPPPSRDTEATEREGPDQLTATTSLVGNGTVRSLSDSVTPLQSRPSNIGLALDARPDYNTDKVPETPALASPSLLPTNFLAGRANNTTLPHEASGGRQERYSAASSPISGPPKLQTSPQSQLGRNHEYFTGNTVFCWGGRLQNTRDRPINIATGLFVVVPGALFLAFSYVIRTRPVCPLDLDVADFSPNSQGAVAVA